MRDDLARLEVALTTGAGASDDAARLYDDMNEIQLAREFRRIRDKFRLQRARLVEHVRTADRPARVRQVA